MEFGQHISQRYNKELEEIRTQVLKMGGLVEMQSMNAIKALLESDAALAKQVIIADHQVNQMEISIDEECTKVIARRQPAAGDLRLIIAVVKVITDLERIGDEAKKIALYAQKLAKHRSINNMHSELSHLSSLVLGIMHRALDAFARLDTEQAIKVFAEDSEVNKEFDNLSRLLITYMMEEPRYIKDALRIMWCARSLERIGAHVQNIGEYVIYLVKGKDVRHTHFDDILLNYFPQGVENNPENNETS